MFKSNIFIFLTMCLIAPAVCQRINSKLYDKLMNQHQNHVLNNNNNDDEPQQQQQHSQLITAIADNERIYKQMPLNKHHLRNDNSIAYVKASIPIRIFQCMQRLSILKCMKIFILQRMERTPIYVNSGNLTADFLDQILTNDDDRHHSNEDIFDRYYIDMDEAEINERLLKTFQRFFKDREIKLHFIPGMVVKVVPSEENAINLSLKRANAVESVGRKKNRTGEYLLNLAVPALMMPAIMVGTVLPFILPALKMAAIISGVVNNAALIAAVMYAAKAAAVHAEAQKQYYFNHRAGATSP